MRTSRVAVGLGLVVLFALLVATPGAHRTIASARTTVEQKSFFPACSKDVPINCIDEVSVGSVPLLPAHVLSNVEVRGKDAKGNEYGMRFGENRHPYWKCAQGQAFTSPSGEACGVGDYPNFLLHAEDASLNFPVGPANGALLDLTTEEGRLAQLNDKPDAYPPAYVGVQVFGPSVFNNAENGFTTRIGSYGFHFDVFNRRGVITEVREDDEYTFRINFGFVPAPNFYGNADAVKYSVSVDDTGATIVEMTLRPVLGASPPMQGRCDGMIGGQRRLYLNTGRFSWGSSAIDMEAKIERAFSGNAVTTNAPCANGMPDIRPDGTLNVLLGAPHAYADGTLNNGVFSVILSPATMYAFGFSTDRVLSGGLSISAKTSIYVQKLSYQATIADDGAAIIKAYGFHYSSPTLSLKQTSFKLPPLKTKFKVLAPTRVGRGRRVEIRLDKAIQNAVLLLRGPTGGSQLVGSFGGAVGQAQFDVVIPRSIPIGRGVLTVWFPGDRQSRNSRAEIPIQITP